MTATPACSRESPSEPPNRIERPLVLAVCPLSTSQTRLLPESPRSRFGTAASLPRPVPGPRAMAGVRPELRSVHHFRPLLLAAEKATHLQRQKRSQAHLRYSVF